MVFPDAMWGTEGPCSRKENGLPVSDFSHCGLNCFEDCDWAGGKVDTRSSPPTAMNAITMSIRQTEIISAVYGEEHLGERTEATSDLEDLHGSYEEVYSPQFPTAVWDEMAFGYFGDYRKKSPRAVIPPQRAMGEISSKNEL